jgi:hypothetical protein
LQNFTHTRPIAVTSRSTPLFFLHCGLELPYIERAGNEKIVQNGPQEEKSSLKKSCDNSPSLDGTQVHENQQHRC